LKSVNLAAFSEGGFLLPFRFRL
ncbi:MAG: hypothetical protein QOI22_1772, partial [Verrucomicrobiota bacterium]